MSKQSKELNLIFKKYKLLRDVHVFMSDDYTIISREGIQNIRDQEGIQVKYELVHCASKEAVIKASGYYEAIAYETFGEASPQNSTFTFPVAIAEKRALSRLILSMIIKDHHGKVMSEDEVKTQPARSVKTATEKGEKAASLTANLMKLK